MQSSYTDLIFSIEAVIGWSIVVFLPGAWVTFGLPLRGLSFWIKILLGTALAPFVVFLQFYTFRLAGFTFESTVLLVVLVNSLPLYLIFRRRAEITSPGRATLLGAALAFLVPLVLLAPQIAKRDVRLFTGHHWMQSDMVYKLADGELLLEEPELAGLDLVYPYAAHPFQAVLSHILGSAPADSYIWTNLVWLLCIYGILAYIVAELGGNRLAQITSILWLCFGLNVLGYVLFIMIPNGMSGEFLSHGPYKYAWYGGDYRITPWMLKFFFFEQGIFGISMLSGLIYMLVRRRPLELTLDVAVLLALLLCGIGFIYPAYFLPAAIALCILVLIRVFDWSNPKRSEHVAQCFRLVAVLGFASVVTYLYLKFLTQDRVTPSIVLPAATYSFVKLAILKSLGAFVSLAVFLVGLAVVVARDRKATNRATIILASSGLSCALLYITLEIPKPSAEYKFLLVAALFLSPFPALALQRYVSRLPRRGVPMAAATAIALVTPAAHKIYTDFPWTPPWPHTTAQQAGFDINLDENSPFAPICQILKSSTPKNTIIVVERSELHFPTVSRRALYAPPLQDLPHPGVFIVSSSLLGTIKGYGKEIIAHRRAVVGDLLNSTSLANRRAALVEILELNRPVAIILEDARHQQVQKWLAREARAEYLFSDGVRSVWVVYPVS